MLGIFTGVKVEAYNMETTSQLTVDDVELNPSETLFISPKQFQKK